MDGAVFLSPTCQQCGSEWLVERQEVKPRHIDKPVAPGAFVLPEEVRVRRHCAECGAEWKERPA